MICIGWSENREINRMSNSNYIYKLYTKQIEQLLALYFIFTFHEYFICYEKWCLCSVWLINSNKTLPQYNRFAVKMISFHELDRSYMFHRITLVQCMQEPGMLTTGCKQQTTPESVCFYTCIFVLCEPMLSTNTLLLLSLSRCSSSLTGPPTVGTAN